MIDAHVGLVHALAELVDADGELVHALAELVNADSELVHTLAEPLDDRRKPLKVVREDGSAGTLSQIGAVMERFDELLDFGFQ